jgi:hypothetical protein
MGKKSGSGSGMTNPDHISESLFFDADPGWKNSDPGSGMEKNRIGNPGWKKFGYGINIPDPQLCKFPSAKVIYGMR